MSDKIYLTKEGLKKLEEELHDLKYTVRPGISKKVNEAREQGDLKENAEYHAARESLSMCETKIQQIQLTLAKAEVVDKKDVKDVHISNVMVVSLVARGAAATSPKKSEGSPE